METETKTEKLTEKFSTENRKFVELPKPVNPTWAALVRLKGAMHTNDPKYRWPRN